MKTSAGAAARPPKTAVGAEKKLEETEAMRAQDDGMRSNGETAMPEDDENEAS